MPTTTVKCESWCVDHNGDEGETCAIKPAFFGPEIDYGPQFGGVGSAGEVFAYRHDDEPVRIVIQCQDGGPGAFIDVEALRAIHAAVRWDADGFAAAAGRILEQVEA